MSRPQLIQAVHSGVLLLTSMCLIPGLMAQQPTSPLNAEETVAYLNQSWQSYGARSFIHPCGGSYTAPEWVRFELSDNMLRVLTASGRQATIDLSSVERVELPKDCGTDSPLDISIGCASKCVANKYSFGREARRPGLRFHELGIFYQTTEYAARASRAIKHLVALVQDVEEIPSDPFR